MSVWFGYHLPSYTHPDTKAETLFDRVVEQAKAAEEAGFGLVTVMDHLYQIGGVGQVDEPMLEGWLTLAALARETKRVRLGTLVTGVTYRNPALLAKQVTTLDTISGGRAVLGLGAAWNDAEHEGYGYEFPPVGERMDRLDEALAIIKLMFTEDRPSFHGEHYQIERALNVPRPVHPGGPPILVGGGGEQRTLRLVARYADYYNIFNATPDEVRHKYAVLAERCREIGRDYGQIVKTCHATILIGRDEADVAVKRERHRWFLGNPLIGTPAQVAEGVRAYQAAGAEYFIFNLQDAHLIEPLYLMAEQVIPAFADAVR